jgi:chitinase
LPTPTEPSASAPFAVIGYFPDYREFNPAWTEHLTDIIYFSAEPRADGTLDTSRLTEATWQLLQQMKTEHATRIHLSIGGWERSSAFGAMTADPLTRHKFISALMEFALAYHLDGVDFDWEFPNGETEFDNYILFLTETKESFSKHDLLVSVALTPDPNFPLADFAVVDRVHLMSYDRAAKHSTFEQAVEDAQLFLDADIPPEKLILGVPFYGRNTSPPYKVLSYEEIMSRYSPPPAVDEVDGVYFNGLETIQLKTCYAMREKLGGVMLWELAHDTIDANSLLQRMYVLATGKISC